MSTTPAPHPYSEQRNAVAAEVRALMGRHRVSQQKLALALGMSQPPLSRRLAGELPFDTDELLGIAAYFDVEVTALLKPLEQGGSSLRWITPECDGQLDLLTAA